MPIQAKALLFVWAFICCMPIASSLAGDKRVYETYVGNTADDQNWSKRDDQMVLVDIKGKNKDFYIDKYEATISKRKAWSVPGQVPTTKLRFADAKEACKNAGKRLCTTQEWQIACRDGQTSSLYFKDTNALMRNCDFARSKGYDAQDFVNKNNSHPKCVLPNLKLNHMIGNVSEMTVGPNGKAVIMGMAYYDAHYKDKHNMLRLSCEHIVIPEGSYPEGRYNEGMGFRCCKNR